MLEEEVVNLTLSELQDELAALVSNGDTLYTSGDSAGALKSWQRAIDLGTPVYADLDASDRASVLFALHNEGVVFAESGDRVGALQLCRQAIELGVPLFTELDADGQAQVLMALYDAGVYLSRTGDTASEMQYYQQAIELGAPVFAEINAESRAQVLGALFNKSFGLGKRDDTAGAMQHWQQAISLGEPVFAELNANGRAHMLRALSFKGDVLGDTGDRAGALQKYQQAIALGAPVYNELDADGRGQVLGALSKKGATLGLTGDTAGLLQHCHQAIELGEPVFAELNANGQAQFLNALFNKGNALSQTGDTAGALQYYQHAIAMGAPVFANLNANGRVLVLQLIGITFVTSRHHTLQRHQSLVQQSVVGPLVGNANLLNQSKVILSNLEPRSTNLQPKLSWLATHSVAHWWLTDFKAFAAKPSRPRQRNQVITLASTLAHQYWQDKNLQHRKMLDAVTQVAQVVVVHQDKSTTSNRDDPQSISSSIAQWASTQAMQSLKQALPAEDPQRLLLARVRASRDPASTACDWPEQAPWRIDPQSLYRALRVEELFFNNGSMRAPYWWLDESKHPRLQSQRFGHAANDAKGELFKALQSWRAGDPSAAIAMLEQGLAQLRTPIFVGDAAAPHTPLSALAEGSQWLQRLGMPAQQADAVVLDGLIYGDIQTVLQDAFAQWISAQLRQTQNTAQAINQSFSQLLRWLPVPTSKYEVLARLHLFLDVQIEADMGSPAAQWRNLEMQRFTLASTAALAKLAKEPDKQALEAVQMALNASLMDLSERIKRIQEDPNDESPSPEFHDIPIALFETLTQELKRLGHALVLPDPQTCAAALKPDEHLVQLWFTPSDGRAHALILSAHDTVPRHVALPQSLALDQWQPLLAVCEQEREYAKSAWWSQSHVPTDAQISRGNPAWAAFVAQDSVTSVLLHSLQQALKGAEQQNQQPRCILLLPANLARLPWLARAVSGTVDGVGDFEAGSLVLDASVSAWLAARSANSTDAKEPMPAGQVVYLPADRCAMAEATLAASALQAQPTQARGMVELTRALQSAGPAHLVVHGQFAPFDPLASYLSLYDEPEQDAGYQAVSDGDKDVTTGTDRDTNLPVWLMACMQVRGDISLSACQGMLVGHGVQQSQWAGPAGIGPLLRACGARSVVGSLGIQNKLASLLFYAQYFEARRELPAAQALARAQHKLRSMSKQEAMAFIHKISPKLSSMVNDHCLNAEECGWPTPFADPEMWAQFTLLGSNTQLLRQQSTASHPSLESTPSTSNTSRTPWYVRLWRRIFVPNIKA